MTADNALMAQQDFPLKHNGTFLGREEEKELARLAEQGDQAAAEKLQAELARVGVVTEKFDFSKASAREAGASSTDAPSAPPSAPSAPAAPMVDPLLSFLSTGSTGSSRLMPSGTSHGYLGAVAGSSSDGGVAEALRGL